MQLKIYPLKPFRLLMALIFCLSSLHSGAQKLKLNKLGYFETPGVNVLVFSSQYNGIFQDEKTAGVELIHHGVRTITGGAVRLQNTPEQWDLVPTLVNRTVDSVNNRIDVTMRYEDYDFNSRISVAPKGNGVELNVYLDKPVPEKLAGRAGFNLEVIPSAYFEKTFLIDGKPGEFPLYPAGLTKMLPSSQKIPQFAGHTTFDDRGRNEFIDPAPLATGRTLVMAPEDPGQNIKIQSADADLLLFDGRSLAQNGWFIVRSLLPPGKTGKVLTWYIEPNAIPGWKRAPVIEFSQVGYRPEQRKTAVIELDKTDTPLSTATLFEVTPDGKYVERLRSTVQQWGLFTRYNYLKFDFSSIKKAGLYVIAYGDQKTNAFPINTNVYENIGHPTMDVWFPVQMDHMMVNEAYRVWHGAPFLDDALQAPPNHQHFDTYKMGPTTDTRYKPLERIPGLNVGGWFDAGDFDIETPSHCNVVLSFVEAWENFKINRDETYVDYATRYVDIHRPDGKPDLLQQIEHGTLNLVAQVVNIGHPARGIIVPNLHQYHHLGDAVNETDNLPYNASLKPYQTDGKSSGTLDDRWAFTTRNISLDYQTTAALAAASRALKGYNDTLSLKSLQCAQKLWHEDDSLKMHMDSAARARNMFMAGTEMLAALQLYITTKDEQYAGRFKELIMPMLNRFPGFVMINALRAYPYMDKEYQDKIAAYMQKYKASCDAYDKQNPYGVPVTPGGWGGSGQVINFAITNYYANKYFPDVIGAEYVYKGLDYIFGCHPYSNLSFVSGVGVRSKKVTYGNNRADFRFIAGGVVPGILLLKPDFPENKEDWPFFWGENEVTIAGCAEYVVLSGAANQLGLRH